LQVGVSTLQVSVYPLAGRRFHAAGGHLPPCRSTFPRCGSAFTPLPVGVSTPPDGLVRRGIANAEHQAGIAEGIFKIRRRILSGVTALPKLQVDDAEWFSELIFSLQFRQ